MKKRQLGLLSTAVLAGVVFLGIPALNYSGFCIAEGRYLTEQELIAIGVRYEFQSYPPRVYPGFSAEVTKPIAYASFEDFIAGNQNCCSLARTARENFSPGFLDRVLGHFATFVRIEYRVEKDVPNVPKTYVSHVAITNCGHQWNGIRL